MATKKPVHQLKSHGITVAIWENDNGDGPPRYNSTVKRSYKDASGQWHETDSLGLDDLPVASKLLDFAFAWGWKQRIAANTQEPGE